MSDANGAAPKLVVTTDDALAEARWLAALTLHDSLSQLPSATVGWKPRCDVVYHALRHWEKLPEALLRQAVVYEIPKAKRGVSDRLRRYVLERDEHRCLKCGATADLHIDHIVPWSLGGPTNAENLQTLCGPCNIAKGVDAIDYRDDVDRDEVERDYMNRER